MRVVEWKKYGLWSQARQTRITLCHLALTWGKSLSSVVHATRVSETLLCGRAGSHGDAPWGPPRGGQGQLTLRAVTTLQHGQDTRGAWDAPWNIPSRRGEVRAAEAVLSAGAGLGGRAGAHLPSSKVPALMHQGPHQPSPRGLAGRGRKALPCKPQAVSSAHPSRRPRLSPAVAQPRLAGAGSPHPGRFPSGGGSGLRAL